MLDKVLVSAERLPSLPLATKPAVKELLCRPEMPQMIGYLFKESKKNGNFRSGVHHLLSWVGL